MKKTLFYSMAVVALGCLAVACNQNSDKNGQQQASSTNEIQMVDATSDTLDTRKPIVKNDKDVEVSIDNVPQVAKDLLAKYFPGKEATRVIPTMTTLPSILSRVRKSSLTSKVNGKNLSAWQVCLRVLSHNKLSRKLVMPLSQSWSASQLADMK